MNAARHCGCIGRPCHHQRLGKIPGVSLESHLERVKIFIHGRLAEVPDDCLRFDHNQALFFLLTLWGDPLRRYRVEELHPGERAFMVARDYCLCKWQPTGFNLNELVDHLMDVGPYAEPPTPNSEDANPPPPIEGDTKEEETKSKKGLMTKEPRDKSEEEEALDEDPEEEPIEEDPKEYPEEDPEEDLEGDSEVGKRQLMSSEDLEGDQGDEEGNHLAQDKQSSNSGDLEEKINYLWNWAEREIGMTH